jgi:endonuclease III
MPKLTIKKVVEKLGALYGEPASPKTKDPFELVLLENVAYLVSDEQREKAFDQLRKKIGVEPPAILTSTHDKLLEVTKLGGMHPELRAKRLRDIAQICLQEFHGDLESVLKLPLPKARRALMKFPSIGEPGAEKILLFTRSYPVLALESNGLRTLVRLGFGQEGKNYSSTYSSVRDAIKDELKADYDWLIRAHLLLRRHGRELCRTSRPNCGECPLTDSCLYYDQMIKPKSRRTGDRIRE